MEHPELTTHDRTTICFDFETGSLRLRFAGYEAEQYKPGGLHDWLNGSAELWLTFGADEASGDSPPVAQLRASTEELSVGSDELSQFGNGLDEMLDNEGSELTFRPFERDVQLTIAQTSGGPTLAVVLRSGTAVTTLDPQPTTFAALRHTRADIARVIARFPPRG